MPRHSTRVSAAEKAKRLIEERNRTIRTADALRAGIHPRTLYQLRDAGELEQVSTGVYRLADQQPMTNDDIATVAARIPRAVICLISALAFHDITTQIRPTTDIDMLGMTSNSEAETVAQFTDVLFGGCRTRRTCL